MLLLLQLQALYYCYLFNIARIYWKTLKCHLLYIITLLENFIENYEMNPQIKNIDVCDSQTTWPGIQ